MDTQFHTYLFRYFYNDQWWGITIRAASEEDARARMNKLPFAQSLGITVATVPAQLGFLPKLMCWWHNLWLRPSSRG